MACSAFDMIITRKIFLALFLVILWIIPAVFGASFISEKLKCLQRERQALLEFKAGIIDEHGQLSSWESEKDCCQWEGILCDNQTNHVVGLDLSEFASLRGQIINPSLLELVDLYYLDLSSINFNESSIPVFIGSLLKLQYLNLSSCNFLGHIPPSLGNLSTLHFLDLWGNWYLHSDLNWLSGFRYLEFLDISYVNLQMANAWVQIVSNLPVVKAIYLRNCELLTQQTTKIPSLNASTSLVPLDLSDNHLPLTSGFSWLLNMSTSLSYIDLANNHIMGEIPYTVKDLMSLSYLGLSFNKFEGSIPDALWNLTNLSHLGLSFNNLGGCIPNTIGNLTHLSHLGLSRNRIGGGIPNTLGNLLSLSHLDLSYNQLQQEFPNQSLSSLTFLDLSHNNLQGSLTNVIMQLWESTMLKHIDLSKNAFFGSLPNMSRFQYLRELRINNNHLNESIGDDSLSLPNLEVLDMSKNKLTGRVPNLSSCSSLTQLSLNDNMFNGTLTKSIGNLFNLVDLNLNSNHLQGEISEAYLFNLSNMVYLDLAYTNLTVRINSLWNPSFQLYVLRLANCMIGPHFPKWLQNQKNIIHLDISSANIVDTIPTWFWNNTQLSYLNMSNNQIHGLLPDFMFSTFPNLLSMDLSFNQFHGSLPVAPPYAGDINLSRNKFSGEINNFCGNDSFSILHVLDLSDNLLVGNIPPFCFTKLMGLLYVNLANNNLSGSIGVDFEDNNVFRDVPCDLISLYLSNNNFTGYIPELLGACEKLIALDLGENNFYGNVPGWLGIRMPELVVLTLKPNHLNGSLPSSLCNLQRIQVLDISMNNISNTIPVCVNNFIMLSSKSDFSSTGLQLWAQRVNWTSFHNRASIMWKGKVAEYVNTLWLLKVIDLSSNNLSGEIPREVTSLVGLVSLNISRNNLVGSIPCEIGQLELLDVLDLAQNNLSGDIPSAISLLSHLGVLDLSFNNLSGKIPYITHIDTFNDSSFIGNPGLCGPPLVSKPCLEGDRMQKKSHRTQFEDMLQSRDFYVSVMVGFSVAFWTVCWTLFFNKKWNIATNKMFLDVEDWLSVKTLVSKRRLQRYFGDD